MRAHDLSVSAFLGDAIYNFGELLMHPILEALNGTEHEWLKRLLFTFNEGNIGKFEALAPMLPRIVSTAVYCYTAYGLFLNPVLAHTPRELPFPQAKDLSDGAYRVGVQEECV